MTDLAVRENQALAVRIPLDEAIEKVLMTGDLTGLSSEQRVEYYNATCKSLGLNPLTRPFEYVVLNDKLQLYPRKDCTEQLRKINHVSINIIERRVENGVYLVVAEARTPDGRRDEASGAVAIEKEGGQWKKSSSNKSYFEGNGQFSPIRGEALANLYMKAETKAKRRVTLSICGLGMADESEIESIPGAVIVEDGTHYAPAPTKYICEECKGEITTSSKGAPPHEVAAFTADHLGRQLCANCANEEMNARKAAREAAKAREEQAHTRQEQESTTPEPAPTPAKGSKAAALATAKARYATALEYAAELGIKPAVEPDPKWPLSNVVAATDELVAAIQDAIYAAGMESGEIPTDDLPGDNDSLADYMKFAREWELVEYIKAEQIKLDEDDADYEEEPLVEIAL